MSTPTQPRIPTAKLGKNGPEIPRLGFGLMGLSAFYGGYESDEKRFEVLDRAIELGETFWDSQSCARYTGGKRGEGEADMTRLVSLLILC